MSKSKKVTGKYIPSSSVHTHKPKTTHEDIAKSLGYNALPKNLKKSLIALYKSGKPIVTPHIWESRVSICRGCSYWEEHSSGTIARCTKCGCSSGKLLLQTSKCPLKLPRW